MLYRYFEDYAVGETVETGSLTITEADIIAFAEKFDPQPMHTDRQAARDITGGLIASGWHTASISMGLFITAQDIAPAPGAVGLGVDTLKWHQPVRPGDTLRVHTKVTASRPSKSRPGHGIVTTRFTTTNQRGETVLELTASALMPKRHTQGPTP